MSEASDVIYMLHDDDGHLVGGPLLGKPGLDMASLVADFRAASYAKSELAGDDYCMLLCGDLVEWLVGRGVLRPMETVSLTAHVDTSGEHAYVPAHWPICPSCGEGRGDTQMGRVLRSLNRAEWYRKCTACGYAWAHHDQAYYFDQPMLDDDGREIDGGCVPYAIAQAGSLNMDDVLGVCREHGWREGHGIDEQKGIDAALQCGMTMIPRHAGLVAGKRTLRRVLDSLNPMKTYIVSTRDHWLAIVKGQNRDQAETSMRKEVSAFWEVVTTNRGKL